MSDDLDSGVLACVYCEAAHGEIHSALCSVRWGRPRLYKPKGAATAAPLTEAEAREVATACVLHQKRRLDIDRVAAALLAASRGEIPAAARRA